MPPRRRLSKRQPASKASKRLSINLNNQISPEAEAIANHFTGELTVRDREDRDNEHQNVGPCDDGEVDNQEMVNFCGKWVRALNEKAQAAYDKANAYSIQIKDLQLVQEEAKRGHQDWAAYLSSLNKQKLPREKLDAMSHANEEAEIHLLAMKVKFAQEELHLKQFQEDAQGWYEIKLVYERLARVPVSGAVEPGAIAPWLMAKKRLAKQAYEFLGQERQIKKNSKPEQIEQHAAMAMGRQAMVSMKSTIADLLSTTTDLLKPIRQPMQSLTSAPSKRVSFMDDSDEDQHSNSTIMVEECPQTTFKTPKSLIEQQSPSTPKMTTRQAERSRTTVKPRRSRISTLEESTEVVASCTDEEDESSIPVLPKSRSHALPQACTPCRAHNKGCSLRDPNHNAGDKCFRCLVGKKFCHIKEPRTGQVLPRITKDNHPPRPKKNEEIAT